MPYLILPVMHLKMFAEVLISHQAGNVNWQMAEDPSIALREKKGKGKRLKGYICKLAWFSQSIERKSPLCTYMWVLCPLN